ncbi:MAG: TniB family NTP-binding protein [Rhodocyclales bacterium]|nr:TniB family NTP-binding protein [Rhodocyclales bacterium]
MSPEERYPHLAPAAAAMADRDTEARIAYILRDRFVPHRQAEEILDELEMLYRMEDAVRPQGRLIVGRSLMGKSTILDEFMRNHRASDNPDGDAAVVPVVQVQFPDQAREGIFPEILSKLNVRLPVNSKSQDLRRHAVDLLRRVGMRLLLIDEFHNVLEGSAQAQRKALNSIKYLMNELRRPVIVAGTVEVLNAVASDEQIHSRLQPMPLARFEDDERFQELLAGFEMLIPLREPSCLPDPVLSSRIYEHTVGIVGNVSDLLSKAAILAIKEGEERITAELIEATKWETRKNDTKLASIL